MLYNPELFVSNEDYVCEICWDGDDSYVVSTCGHPVGKVAGGEPITASTDSHAVVALCADLLGEVIAVDHDSETIFVTCRANT